MNADREYYYLEPSCPAYVGSAIQARMQVWALRPDGTTYLEIAPVLLYPEGNGASPGGKWVAPIARLAPEASQEAKAYHRGHVGGWTLPE